jgi:hypothetical protein
MLLVRPFLLIYIYLFRMRIQAQVFRTKIEEKKPVIDKSQIFLGLHGRVLSTSETYWKNIQIFKINFLALLGSVSESGSRLNTAICTLRHVSFLFLMLLSSAGGLGGASEPAGGNGHHFRSGSAGSGITPSYFLHCFDVYHVIMVLLSRVCVENRRL